MSIRLRFRRAVPAFALDVDLELPGQGVSALFGPSGSGKTTLLRCIAGLERAAGGLLEVNGEVWQDDSRGVFVPTHRRPLGMVFQDAGLFAHLSVRGNLEFGQKRGQRGVAAAARQVALDQAVDLLGIGHLLERAPAGLSGGERQRVAIARALLTSPRLLLLDEPLAALDHARKAEILPYLERLHDELSMPVLYVSHAADEVARLADTLVLLDRGRALAAGPLAEILPRLDLPLAHGDDAGVVVAATVAVHDPAFALTRVDFPGGGLWVGHLDKPPGTPVRVRVQARDVSIALAEPLASSIVNILPAEVVAVDHDEPGRSLVRLRVGAAPLLARITRKSALALALAPGLPVFAQIKGVALLG